MVAALACLTFCTVKTACDAGEQPDARRGPSSAISVSVWRKAYPTNQWRENVLRSVFRESIHKNHVCAVRSEIVKIVSVPNCDKCL